MLETHAIYTAVGSAIGALGLVTALWLDCHMGNNHRARRRYSPTAPPAASPPTDLVELGEWLHEALMEAYGAERAAWALERVQQVGERLQADRPGQQRLHTEILWIPEVNASTGPGRYIAAELNASADVVA